MAACGEGEQDQALVGEQPGGDHRPPGDQRLHARPEPTARTGPGRCAVHREETGGPMLVAKPGSEWSLGRGRGHGDRCEHAFLEQLRCAPAGVSAELVSLIHGWLRVGGGYDHRTIREQFIRTLAELKLTASDARQFSESTLRYTSSTSRAMRAALKWRSTRARPAAPMIRRRVGSLPSKAMLAARRARSPG